MGSKLILYIYFGGKRLKHCNIFMLVLSIVVQNRGCKFAIPLSETDIPEPIYL
jgi:hypothetical protein